MAREKTARTDRTRLVVLLLLLVVVLLLWVGVVWTGGRSRAPAATGGGAEALAEEGTAAADSARAREGAIDSARAADSASPGRDTVASDVQARRHGPVETSSTGRHSGVTSAPADGRADTAGVSEDKVDGLGGDSLGEELPELGTPGDPCEQDTVAPWVYPDPSGGLHRRTVKLQFVPDEPCLVEWRYQGELEWREYGGDWVVLKQSRTLEYRGTDGCGNAMAVQSERYEIKVADLSSRCPSEMELVSIGGTEFCVDRYEWPNRRKARPSAFVSIYQAMDSCFSAGKRLCTTDEWKLACSGPYGWSYPYGDVFERRACVTHDTATAKSGSRPECRGYFEVYDMSGNLLEWTSTRSTANNRFYNVMGGFWESGAQAGCFNVRYSYFPQNRHNPVGFRCCKEAGARGEASGGGKGASQ